LRGSIDSALERLDVFRARKARRLWQVPDRAMRAAILGRASPRIPRPLVHGDEVNVRLALDKWLATVAVVHVPIDDQEYFESMLLPGVVRSDRHVAKQTEAHGPIVNGLVARRP